VIDPPHDVDLEHAWRTAARGDALPRGASTRDTLPIILRGLLEITGLPQVEFGREGMPYVYGGPHFLLCRCPAVKDILVLFRVEPTRDTLSIGAWGRTLDDAQARCLENVVDDFVEQWCSASRTLEGDFPKSRNLIQVAPSAFLPTVYAALADFDAEGCEPIDLYGEA
jgi:hypothetical protein